MTDHPPQTTQQMLVKTELYPKSLANYESRFHYKFWQPISCVGGKVWFGRYWVYVEPNETEFTN